MLNILNPMIFTYTPCCDGRRERLQYAHIPCSVTTDNPLSCVTFHCQCSDKASATAAYHRLPQNPLLH